MNALEVVAARLKEKEAQLKDFLADGGAKNFEHYASITGEIKGIMYAYNELKDTNDKILQEDNDD